MGAFRGVVTPKWHPEGVGFSEGLPRSGARGQRCGRGGCRPRGAWTRVGPCAVPSRGPGYAPLGLVKPGSDGGWQAGCCASPGPGCAPLGLARPSSDGGWWAGCCTLLGPVCAPLVLMRPGSDGGWRARCCAPPGPGCAPLGLLKPSSDGGWWAGCCALPGPGSVPLGLARPGSDGGWRAGCCTLPGTSCAPLGLMRPGGDRDWWAPRGPAVHPWGSRCPAVMEAGGLGAGWMGPSSAWSEVLGPGARVQRRSAPERRVLPCSAMVCCHWMRLLPPHPRPPKAACHVGAPPALPAASPGCGPGAPPTLRTSRSRLVCALCPHALPRTVSWPPGFHPS